MEKSHLFLLIYKNKKMYKTGQFAKMIKVSTKTLYRWDKLNILKPEHRSSGNRKYYSHKQYLEYFNLEIKQKKKIVAYCRVSSNNQKHDLKSQEQFLIDFAFNRGSTIDEIYKDIGSGLNYKRLNFIKLIKNIINGEIQELIVAHKDRLVRFGFELIEWLCNEYNVKLTIINDEKMSPSDEMVKDLISIIHVFSSRFYGLRRYKKNIINDICKETPDIPN